MLAATRLLLAADVPFDLRRIAGDAVAVAGGPDDVAALLERMLVAPDDLLAWPLMARGGRDVGDQLLNTFVVDGALRDGAPEVVLHALGWFGVEEAEPILWTAAHARDHYLHRSACLGLVDLPCAGREAAIADAIRACHGHNLFGEFWPALAGKVGDPALLDPFYAPRAPTSTDCFGGVLLGLALVRARTTFERILFDPFWEATDGGTGNRRWCGLAVRILGLSLRDLRRAREPDPGVYAREVLADLVWLHACGGAFAGLRAALPPADDDLTVYSEFLTRPRALAEGLPRDGPAHARLDEAAAALAERLALALQSPL